MFDKDKWSQAYDEAAKKMVENHPDILGNKEYLGSQESAVWVSKLFEQGQRVALERFNRLHGQPILPAQVGHQALEGAEQTPHQVIVPDDPRSITGDLANDQA